MLIITFGLILLIGVLIYIFMTWNFNYWRKRNIPGPKPRFLTGNMPNMFSQKRHTAYDILDIYREFKKDYDIVGIFNSRVPQLLVVSPELVRRVMVTDFKHFHDNEISQLVDEKSDYIFANNPFILTGEKWKEQRSELTPGLTMSRIKSVYPVTQKICESLRQYIRKQVRIGDKDGIDCCDLCLRYTSEVVTDCVLGLEAKSFSDNPTPILGKIQSLFSQTWTMMLELALVSLCPFLKHFRKIRLIPKASEEFFKNLLITAIEIRKQQTKEGNQLDRIDFMNYLLSVQKKKQLSNEQMTAHTMTFLLDGFETTGLIMAHTLLMLARNKEIQQKLRAEIVAAADQGKIDFEKIHELPYLDACIHETIRFFPPGFISNRICTEPLELSNRRGQTFTIQKGEVVSVPHFAFMWDKEYFPEPQEYRPERYTGEPDAIKKYREKGVLLVFGDGPRICIGMRFALTQIKAALADIMLNFDLEINSKTRKDNQFDPKYFLARLDGGIWVNFKERKENK